MVSSTTEHVALRPIPSAPASRGVVLLRLLQFIFLVYLFLVAINMFGDSTKMLTQEYESVWSSLVAGLNNPFVGLCLGIFATALMQSSSATTSLAVAMVASETITLQSAVTIVMGANIGSSLTCMLVSLGHMGRHKTFSRAFSAALIQDNFNLLTVMFCFTLEMATHFLSRTATWVSSFFFRGVSVSVDGSVGGWFVNPIPIVVSFPVEGVETFLVRVCGVSIVPSAILMCVMGLGLLFFSLIYMTRSMKSLMADRIEEWMNRVLSKNGYLGMAIGCVVTMVIQSSGITTSLMVPLMAAGVLSLRLIYPIVLGANIGTTITAILAAMAYTGTPSGQTGMSLALVHLLFNLTGVMLFYPIPWMRWPIFMTEFLCPILTRRKRNVIGWILLIFFLIPGVGLWLFYTPST